ncbi:MAG: carboxypeptidase-like regulatory domain-containing protein [bacterium]
MITRSKLTKSIFAIFLLVALIISAGSLVFGEEQSTMTISISPETPPSQAVPQGTQNFLATIIRIQVSGCASLNGVTVAVNGLCTDLDFEHIEFRDQDLVLGYGTIKDKKLKLTFSPIPLLLDQTKDFQIFVEVDEQAGVGNTFAFGIIDVGTNADMIGMPVGGAFGNIMSIAELEEPEEPAAAIFGYIFSLDSGKPVSNALIIAIHAESKKKIKALSEKDGRYIFENLEPGAYWLITIQQGYWPDVSKTYIYPEEQKWVDIWLKPK